MRLFAHNLCRAVSRISVFYEASLDIVFHIRIQLLPLWQQGGGETVEQAEILSGVNIPLAIAASGLLRRLRQEAAHHIGVAALTLARQYDFLAVAGIGAQTVQHEAVLQRHRLSLCQA